MYIVPIAWLYVALMMAVAEATSPIGTVLGAIITFLLYGALPVALVVYLMRAPARRRAIKAREAAEIRTTDDSTQPDTSDHATTDPMAPVRIEP
jgi:membrane protein implicated in regulation of membrane protease activity